VPIDYTKRPRPPASGAAPSTPTPPSTPAPPFTPAAAPTSSRVVLTKSAPTVSLTKQGSTSGLMRVNLNWNARPAGQPQPQPQPQRGPQGGGLLRRMMAAAGGAAGETSGGIDLDLGCLYEYTDGSKGVVQALGNTFRDQHGLGPAPICWLDADDRSGATSGGENLFVDLTKAPQIKRVLVFAFIYSGVANWAAADGVVTLFPASGPQVEVRLDEADSRSVMCAIAMLENTGGDLSVRREVRYVQGGHKALDDVYGWGLRWAAGRK
jgi:tellurite resistance protein TerA